MNSKCKFCGLSDSILLFEGINADDQGSARIPILECRNCGIVISSTNSANLDELYYESYYGESSKDNLLNKIATKLFQYERRHKALKQIKFGRILDIGCGDGTFLANLGERWECFGIEPSQIGNKLSSSLFNVKLIKDPLELGSKFFDVITLWQSFEHVDNPGELLDKINEAIKDEGIVFISVPNFASIQARVFKGYWFHLDPTRHCIHYTLQTISDLATKSGFRIHRSDTCSIEYGIYGWLQSILNKLGFEFNYLYKKIKSRGETAKKSSSRLLSLIYILIIPPLLAFSLLMFLIETMAGRGGVLNITLLKESSNTAN